MDKRPRITTKFNALMVLYSSACGFLAFAFSDAAKDVPIQGIVLTSLIDFVRYMAMLFLSAYFARELWNRLIVDIFDLRPVLYGEAVAMVVAVGLLV
ncbi:hypothetical protein CA13_10910 [Planctomycetes bacterium CA13]|uniref:Uncharacterized protein n=1 Tax=Novipirellula herctigrandis TaxID=2527986 RepID=A0A5C5YXC8_9BACT|nr:hypothetical protein CA13_10910 [Planctomycetes bacterium CA13]